MAKRPLFARNPDVISDVVDRVTTVLDPRTAELYELNEVAAMVWDECRQPRNVASVAGQLKKAFPKQPLDRLRSEAEAFIAQLVGVGLLQRVGD